MFVWSRGYDGGLSVISEIAGIGYDEVCRVAGSHGGGKSKPGCLFDLGLTVF